MRLFNFFIKKKLLLLNILLTFYIATTTNLVAEYDDGTNNNRPIFEVHFLDEDPTKPSIKGPQLTSNRTNYTEVRTNIYKTTCDKYLNYTNLLNN